MMTGLANADAPAALLFAVLFLAFGVFAIIRPQNLRAAMDNFANVHRRGSWHPYQMSPGLLRIIVGSVGVAGAALFVYIAVLALTR